MSFLEDRGEIRRYEGNLEVRTAFETGRLRRDFEECLERRARIRVTAKAKETVEQRRAREALERAREAREQAREARERAREAREQAKRWEEEKEREAREQAKRWEEEKERNKEQEEKRKQKEQREIDEARRAAVEERRKRRPEFVSQLLAMNLNKAPIRDIKNTMKKFELNPAGLLERQDLIAELKRGVPELRMKLDEARATTSVKGLQIGLMIMEKLKSKIALKSLGE